MLLSVAVEVVPRLRNGSTALRSTGNIWSLVTTRTVVTDAEEWSKAKPFDQIPGPKPLPLIGNVWRFFPRIGDLGGLDFLGVQKEFHKRYGRISKLSGIPGRRDIVFLCDPDDVKQIYRNEGIWPIRHGTESWSHYRNVTRADVYQGQVGLAFSQGKQWGDARTKVNQPMMQPRTVTNYVGVTAAITDEFVEIIRGLRDGNQETPADFLNDVTKWTLESVAAITLDTRLGLLEPNLSPDSEPVRMMNAATATIKLMYILDLKRIHLWKYFNTPTYKKFIKANDTMYEISSKYTYKALDRLKARRSDDTSEQSLLEKLLAEDPDPRTAIVTATDMLFGGIDTTAHASINILYHLAKNQDKQQILYEEIHRVLSSNPGPLTMDHLNNMTYLKACIKEGLRISSVAAANFRCLVKDMVINGYQIPEGTDAVLCHLVMSNLEEHYPEPDKFLPERWLRDRPPGCPVPSHKDTNPFVTLPFGFGPRMCVGRRFAELEMQTLITKLLTNFRVEYKHGEMKYRSEVLYMTDSPLKFKMVDRVRT